MRSGDDTAGFELATPTVPPHLRCFVEAWTGYREWSPHPVRRVEYPTGRAVLIFEFGPALGVGRPGGALVQHGGFFAGIDDLPSVTEFQRAQAGIQVTLTAAGALSLGGSPFAREVVALDDLGFSRSLADQLASARTWPERFRVVTRLLEAKLERRPRLANVVSWAVARIDASAGLLRIDELSRELGFSRKHLHETFVEQVGLSPKRYADLRRFDLVMQRLRAGNFVDLASLAVELGFADQPHLARTVLRFTGNTTRGLEAALNDPLSVAVNAAPESGA